MNTVPIALAKSIDLPGVLKLLDQQHLPPDGLQQHIGTLVVARQGDEIVGSAALEVYAQGALLRSVAVSSTLQGHGLGRRLIDEILQRARALGLPALYLLTTSADGYFLKLGFERISRDEIPDSVRASVEFTSACPTSAIVMRRLLRDA